MRVALIAEQLRGPVPGGIGRYIRGLVQGLRSVASDAVDVTLIASGTGGVAELGLPVRTVPLPSPLLIRAWQRGLVPVSSDVVHATSLLVPWRGRGPRVVTVHDVAWRVVPETFPARGRRWHERSLLRAVARAAALVAPSESTAAALRHAGAPAERVTVIEEGCDHLPPPDDAAGGAVLDRLGVAGPFLLTVSTLEPRKNLPRLLAAYTDARGRLPEPWPLVVVGPSGWGPAVHPVPGALLAGAVSDGALASLYTRARGVAYVPLVEGFGLPAVEAMHAGTPVLASPMPSTDGASLEVDPLDVEALSAGIVAVATDEARRASLVAAGHRRAAQLRWDATAAAHIRLWEAVS